MSWQLLFLGGNGHCAARLQPAWSVLERLAATGQPAAFTLLNTPYPGFEDRPRSSSFEAFLSALSVFLQSTVERHPRRTLLYGTGIGGLLALCLRARGEGQTVPLLLQAPVLWGLERRLMPRIMRLGPVRFLLNRLFAAPLFQAWFVRRQFERPLSPALRRAFFAGYAHCPAAADFFAWLTPGLLRHLEDVFRANPGRLERIVFWWGQRDRVVSLQELALTETALRRRWPVRTFPHWGHYPMIDQPEDWVRTVSDALAPTGALSQRGHPEIE
jgi:pimeloyl-ACP methyl ester carboxylesterase